MPGTEDSVEDMLKFIYVILMNLFRAPYMIPKMHKEADHPEKYSEETYDTTGAIELVGNNNWNQDNHHLEGGKS